MKTPDGMKPCGCGGRPVSHSERDRWFQRPASLIRYYVECPKCGTRTTRRRYETEAKDAWNRAMGVE